MLHVFRIAILLVVASYVHLLWYGVYIKKNLVMILATSSYLYIVASIASYM